MTEQQFAGLVEAIGTRMIDAAEVPLRRANLDLADEQSAKVMITAASVVAAASAMAGGVSRADTLALVTAALHSNLDDMEAVA